MGDDMSFRLPSAPSRSRISSPRVRLAHHPMGGKTPSTFIEGLLSGLGHPVIGLDHLAFLLVGVAVGVGGLNLVLPVVFVVAMAIGVAAHVKGVNLPAAEIVVALSVLLAGFLIARGRALPVALWAAFSRLPASSTATRWRSDRRCRDRADLGDPRARHRPERAHRRRGPGCAAVAAGVADRAAPGRGRDHRGRRRGSLAATPPGRMILDGRGRRHRLTLVLGGARWARADTPRA